MAPAMSKNVIWGTPAFAAVMLLVIGSIMIVLCWRSRDRARFDQAYTLEERRPNGYSESHFWITDADVARMSGSRTDGRSSSLRKYGPTRGYTSVAARENSLSRPFSKAVPIELVNRQPSITTKPSWPSLPLRLTRSCTAPGRKLSNLPPDPMSGKSVMVRQNDAPRRIEQEPMRNGQSYNSGGRISRETVQIPMPSFPRNPHLGSFGDSMFTLKSLSYDKSRRTAQPWEL